MSKYEFCLSCGNFQGLNDYNYSHDPEVIYDCGDWNCIKKRRNLTEFEKQSLYNINSKKFERFRPNIEGAPPRKILKNF